MTRVIATLIAIACSSGAIAQQFTTAAEVGPILTATKANWVAVRKWEGQDLLYFTHLESWRCGLSAVRFSVNGGAEIGYGIAPCLEETAQPNALPEGHLPYVSMPLEALSTVAVTITYDDGTEDMAEFERAAIEIP